MNKDKTIKEIASSFKIAGDVIDISDKNKGNINKSYVVTSEKDGVLKKYLLQKINTNVFKEPEKLMKNIENVTNHIKNKNNKLDINKPCLELVLCNNDYYLKIRSDYYRMYNYIDNSISYDVSTDKNVVYNIGKAFGNFQKLLNDYPVDMIYETIKDFHNTSKRYYHFLKTIKEDNYDRVGSVLKEIRFIEENSYVASLITNLIDRGDIPQKITHNDTKVNNVLMDKYTNDFLTVVDLDTVMIGSSLYDYADGVRSCCSNVSEDETNLLKVSLNIDLFKAYTDGYLSEVCNQLTLNEIKNMANSILVLTYELALRFLDDYVDGDNYFTIKYENHNLDRARNQIMLFKDIAYKYRYLNEYIISKYNDILNKGKVLSKNK